MLGGGLGVTSLILPAAVAAASQQALVPAAFSYAGSETVVAGWQPFDTGVAANSTGEGVAATQTDNDNLVTRLTLGGTTTSVNAGSPADPEISGLNTDGTYSEWRVRNGSSTLNLATSPHLQFTIGIPVDKVGTLSLATLVLHAVRHMGTGGESALLANLAVYVSTDGFATATLRRTASVSVGASFRHIVVNLGLTASLGAGQTVTVRVYPYSMPNARVLRFGPFNADPSPVDIAADAVDGDRVNAILQDRNNWMAAFVGVFPPPS